MKEQRWKRAHGREGAGARMARPCLGAGMWQGQPLPKIYWHVISSALVKALGSRKAKGTGEHRVGKKKSSQALSFSNKRRWEEDECAYSMFPIPGTGKVPVCRRM